MIAKRLTGKPSQSMETDFGVLVNAKNVQGHLEKQKEQLLGYLQAEKENSAR